MGSTVGMTGADGRLVDPARLRRLRATGLVDGPTQPSLDRLARAAAHQLRAGRAQVTLITADRRVVVGQAGPPLTDSFCRQVVDADAPLLIDDARTDERVSGHPAVADGVIAYAGFPVRSPDGLPLGSFCVIDEQPREWNPRELLLIEDLAAAAATELALRAANLALTGTARRMAAILDDANDAYVSIDVYGAVVAWNRAAEKLFGYPAEEVVGRAVVDLIIPARYRDAHAAGLLRLHNGGPSTLAGQRLQLSAHNRAGVEFPIEMTLHVDRADGDTAYHAFLHDITERVDERRQLDDERTFLRALLESLDAGVAACDADGRLNLFNRAMREIHQADSRPVAAAHWSSFHLYAPDGRTPLRPDEIPLARAFLGEQVDGQTLVVAPPGAVARTFQANARSIETPDGRRLGAVVAMHDVTEQRRAEVLRDLQLAVARVLVEAGSAEQAANDVVETVARGLGWAFGEFWQADDDTATISRVGHWVSPEHDLSAVTGDRPFTLSRGEGLAGHIWADGAELWVTEVADDPRTVFRGDAAREAGLHTAVGLPVRSAGRVLGVLLFFSTTTDEPDEELLGLLDGVCAHLGRHIERHRAEDLAHALAAARRDFARVIEQVNDHVWTIEILTDGAASLFASPDASGIFGEQLPAGADIAAKMAQRVHPDDRPIFVRFIAELRSGESSDVEMRIVGADAVTRWVWSRAVPRLEGGRIFVDGISTNITERRHLSEQREQLLADQQAQNRQLRHLDQVKDDLVALVSHELRNPLAAIRSYSETLLEDPDLTAEQHHLAEVIDRRSGHMQSLVDDLLDVARMEAGQLQIDPKPLSATRLIRDVLQAQQPAADAKALTVTLEAPRHLAMQADPVRIRQVLDNLVANAVKYTPAGGTVTIAARPPADPAGQVVVTITDNGIGIPADELPHLFERFFRASNAVARGITGTGLGLAITKAIVDAHGGTLTAAPAADGGMTFTLTLPAG
ncbi:ATP-binding protein [Micromonosporaceae bacterium Da 78-11]